MEKITLDDIIRITGGVYRGPESLRHRAVADIVTDSRQAAPGALFAAFRGARADGHDYVPEALRRGALAALGEDDVQSVPYIKVESSEQALGDIARHYRSLFPVKVIAVSGSVGKTTGKEMLAAVLAQKYRVLKTEGNFNNALGLPLTLFRLNGDHQVAVLEMGVSDFGEMRRLASIARPELAVLTNIGDAHLERLGDRNGVLRAKTELVEYLPPGGALYLNGDDALLAAYQPPPGLRGVRYGTRPGCEVCATDIVNNAQGISCRIEGLALACGAGGGHLIYSILIAYAVGRDLGLTGKEIASGVASFAPLSGRGNVLETHLCRIIDHTYNANPASMRAALDVLAAQCGRKVAVLGDMYELGEDSPSWHREIGAYAAAKADVLICVGELARDIYQAACGQNIAAYHAESVESAVKILPFVIRPGDQVLVKASHSLHLERLAEALAIL